jgi:hypothetical protein
MQDGLGNVIYGSTGGSGGGGVTIAGARNGASIDGSNFVVLGESIAEGGQPAKLLSSREIPMEGLYVNWFGGPTVLSPDAEAPTGSELLQIIHNELGDTVVMEMELLNKTPATAIAVQQNSPGLLFQGNGWDNIDLISKSAAWEIMAEVVSGSGAASSNLNFLYSDNGGAATVLFAMNNFGQMTGPQFIAEEFITSGGVTFDNIPGIDFGLGNNEGGTGDGTLYLRNTTGSGGIPTAFSAANMDDGTNREYYKLGWNNTTDMVVFSVEAQGTGVVRPVAFLPPIRYGDNNAPTAIINIAPSTGAANGGPFKLTAGPLLAVPEDGLIEYDGTNYYKTIGVTRSIIL